MSSLIVSAIFLAFILVPGFDGATPDSTCEGKKKFLLLWMFFQKKNFVCSQLTKEAMNFNVLWYLIWSIYIYDVMLQT